MNRIREHLKALEPYRPVSTEFNIRIDANESPMNVLDYMTDQEKLNLLQGAINEYPTDIVYKLKKALSIYANVKKENILPGNGSDEILKIIFDTVIDPQSKVVSHGPTFSQYKTNTLINNGIYKEVICGVDCQIPIKAFLTAIEVENPDLVILCNPNNPTGLTVNKDFIISVIKASPSWVLIDEAYIEFGGQSAIDLISEFDNLIIIRTLSKALGLAGARVGYLISQQKNIALFEKVKMPYNVNAISAQLAINVLMKDVYLNNMIQSTIDERERIYRTLQEFNNIDVVNSQGNFVFLTSPKSELILAALRAQNIQIRDLSTSMDHALRITVSTSQVNEKVLNIIKEVVS